MHYNEVNTFKESVMLKAWTGNKQGEIVDSEAGAGVQQGDIEAAAESEARAGGEQGDIEAAAESEARAGGEQGDIEATVESEARAGGEQGDIEAAADSEAENEDQEAATKARAPTGVVGGKGSMELTWVPLMVLMVKKHSMILLK